MYQTRLAENLPGIRERVAGAAARAGRDPESVRIIPVTKGHPVEAVEAVVDAGFDEVGENRVEELERKARALEGRGIRWHMIGHLQSRKAPQAREFSHLLHSLDSVRLAERLDRVAAEGADPFPVLIQVNTSGESAKYGFTPGEAIPALGRILELPGLRVEGFMTMAPYTDDEGVLRGTFRRLRELQERARNEVAGYGGRELSMGMSNDYELAVEEGSTMLRLGTVLLGERGE
jgi:PLP dependent protein